MQWDWGLNLELGLDIGLRLVCEDGTVALEFKGLGLVVGLQ